MRTSIATVSLGGSLVDKLSAISAAGFQGIEIFEVDLLSCDLSPLEIGRLVRDLGLEIVAFQPFRDFEGMPEPQRGRNFERARRKFQLMNELGTENILVCSNISPASLGGIDRAANDLRELGELAEGFGVNVGYEALAWGKYIWDYRDAWEVVKRADHPRVGIILDSFHMLSRGLPVEAVRSIPADRITFVQIADAPKLDMDLLKWSRFFRNFPGQGDLPVLDFMRAVADTGYDGWLSLEIFNDQFRTGLPRQVAKDGNRSLIWMMEGMGKRTLPPPAVCKGFEFLEFSVDDENAKPLTALLRGLGFQPAGTHKSKDVVRWCQGDINLVVNTESDGFAHSYQLVHGTSVCALGLRLDNAQTAMARAGELLADTFHQAVGPGELEIPAVRGPGGSLIYFTDESRKSGMLWEADFEPASVDGHGAGLTRIDHIAMAMTREEILRWRLFYLSQFDFEKTPQTDIADPSGIIESQVVQSPDRSVRICLNASDSTRTMASRFMTEYFGTGIQHIAFATDDIFATVEKLKANGVVLLHIPQNYYDDLEARLGLTSDLIGRMQELNILYDQDEAGAYYQVYTDVFADRFFFEVVQRCDYDGFGAANAPIRLAAQSLLPHKRDDYSL